MPVNSFIPINDCSFIPDPKIFRPYTFYQGNDPLSWGNIRSVPACSAVKTDYENQ